MSDFLVFNHHSLPYQDTGSASDAVLEFLRICIDAQVSGISTILLDAGQDASWFRIEIARNYFWQDWFEQVSSDPKMKDQIRAFRSISTRTPLFNTEDIGGELELFDVIEKTTGNSFSALRASAWYESPLVSFPCSIPWTQHPIEIRIDTIDEVSGTITSQDDVVKNIYSFPVWESEKQAYVERRVGGIKNGMELWNRRSEVFRNLGFCGRTQAQLSNWSHTEAVFDQVKESLQILDRYVERWATGKFPDYSHASLRQEGMNRSVSGESQSVNNDPSKKSERMIYLPDARCEYFEAHVKLSQGFRIHFFPDSQAKKIWVGHVGPHLKL